MLKILVISVILVLGTAILLAAVVRSGSAVQATLVQLEMANGPHAGPAQLVP